MTDTRNKFFSRDRAKAFDEIKEMMYSRMIVCEEAIISDPVEQWGNQWEVGYDDAIRDEIKFIRSVIDMMERS